MEQHMLEVHKVPETVLPTTIFRFRVFVAKSSK